MHPFVKAGLAAGALLVAAAPAASAETIALDRGGATTLKLDPAAAKALTSLGVKAAPVRGARAGRAGIAFPITGGSIDPATGVGVYRHSGGLRLSKGSTRVTLTNFTVAVNRTSTMSAVVNGGQRVGVLVPVVGKARVARPGIDTTVSNVSIHLSTKGAAALNKAFGVTAFKRALKLGTATLATKAAEAALTGGATELALDPGAASALQSLGVSAAPAAPATATSAGALAFPITEGRVNAKTLAGTITHSGGVTFSRREKSLTVTDFVIDTRAATLTAKAGAASVGLLSLDLSKPEVAIASRAVTVGNVTAKLTQAAADALNATFETNAFTAGLTLGTATVKARTA